MLKNDHVTYVCQVTCKCKKTVSVEVLKNIPFSNCLKNHLMRAQENVFCVNEYMGIFAKCSCFHWA